ncbi:MAG: CocE/NonD family hydrolase [Steroidobacteraceae bacterium]
MQRRDFLVLASLASLAWWICPSAGASAATSDPMYAKWHVPPEYELFQPQQIKPHWAKRLTGYLKTRDGTELRYGVLLPPGKGRFPAIIEYSGYDPGAAGGYAYLHNDTSMSTTFDRTLLDHGYAVMGVNARGTGCSRGTFTFLGPTFGRDGADAVDWAARQSWSDGDVGMAGWSWAGMSQIATASNRPAQLRAIAPGMAMTDPRSDDWAIGGVPSQGLVTGWWQFLHSRWLAVRRSAVMEHDQGCVAQVDRNYAAAETPAINVPSQLIRHPLRDAWTQEQRILDQVDRIQVPVLSMEAFQDDVTTARAGYYQERLDPDRVWLVQTNGGHDLYLSLRFRAALVAFMDHFVKGESDGFERKPQVQVWMESKTEGMQPDERDENAAPEWVIHRDRLPVAVDALTLTLNSGKRLDRDGKTGGAPDSYDYPVEGPAVNLDPDKPAWGPLSPQWRRGSVAYTSAPLDESIVIYGPVSANLWVSTTQSDSDLQVTLTDVRPDGEEQYVQRGWLRLSDRALDPRRSTIHLPVLCDLPKCMEAVTPGCPVLARVELTKVAQAFRTGDRIRVWIDAPSATGSNSFDHSSLPATNRIWHDPEHRSQIVFGVIAGVPVPSQRPSCGTTLMQPCRRDPLR